MVTAVLPFSLSTGFHFADSITNSGGLAHRGLKDSFQISAAQLSATPENTKKSGLIVGQLAPHDAARPTWEPSREPHYNPIFISLFSLTI
jgi:hypothetical protein